MYGPTHGPWVEAGASSLTMGQRQDHTSPRGPLIALLKNYWLLLQPSVHTQDHASPRGTLVALQKRYWHPPYKGSYIPQGPPGCPKTSLAPGSTQGPLAGPYIPQGPPGCPKRKVLAPGSYPPPPAPPPHPTPLPPHFCEYSLA
jgi:hypothetical protein